MRSGLGLDFLDQTKYVCLRGLSESCDNSLRLVIQEALTNRDSTPAVRPFELPELAALKSNAIPIESTASCRTFELTWKRYAAYLVTEEFVGSCDSYGDEAYTGKLFRVYSKSHFLDHLSRDTGGHLEPLLHYKVVCLNHLIDVASYSPPEIRQAGSGAAESKSVH